MIYFARSVLTGLVKIGYTAGNPAKRLEALATGAGPLELVATLEGDTTIESALHERFADDRSHGEWFALSEETVTALVEGFEARRATGAIVKRRNVYHARFHVDGRTISESTGSGDKRVARQYLARRLGEIRAGATPQPTRKPTPRPATAREEVERLEKQLDEERRQHALAMTVRAAMPAARVELLSVPAEGIADVLSGVADRAYRRDTYGPEYAIWCAAADAARVAFERWKESIK